MKRIVALLIAVVMILSLAGCVQVTQPEITAQSSQETTAEVADTKAKAEETQKAEAPKETENAAESDAVDAQVQSKDENVLFKIVYTNDIHSYVYNTKKDADGNVTPALRMSNVAACIHDLENAGNTVFKVDAGDIAEGSVYGSIDKGFSVMEMAQLIDYDAVTAGNHDCDFGLTVIKDWYEEYGIPFTSCNFKSTATKDTVMPPYRVIERDGIKVAFVGICAPNTIVTSTPANFQDENGKFLFYVEGSDNVQDMFNSVQNAVDEARKEADYVIALGHVGVDTQDALAGKTSRDIIKNTNGIDAFIDGHSHDVVKGEEVNNKDGKPIILTQTGCYLGQFGVMTVTKDGMISTELLTGYDKADEAISILEDGLNERVEDFYSKVVANNKHKLYVNNPENHDERLIRAMEMNIGDFIADSYYWYFNKRLGMDCDVSLVNGGGIRTGLNEGEVKLQDLKSISPFGNQVCMVRVDGQDILDALECGATVTGEIDPKWNAPTENGGFMQVAGLKYSIDASVPSKVVRDDQNMFVKVDGDYRVHDVQVYDKASGEWVPLDVNKKYTLGGINYLLRNSGDGMTMFKDSEMVTDFVGEDYLITAQYARSFKDRGDGDGVPYICVENGDLVSYKGYPIDYKNPYGSGRITIENVDYTKK